MIYFIQAANGGPIKIGYARKVLPRLKGLQTGHSDQLCVLATMPGDKRNERALHERFVCLRTRGEWFNPGPDLLRLIKEQATPWAPAIVSRRYRQKDVRTPREAEFRRRFAAGLKRCMTKHGMSTAQTAEALGVSSVSIRNYCSGLCTPHGIAFNGLIALFGADLLNEIGPMFGFISANVGTREARALEAVNKLSPALDALAEMVAA